jgi:hypothetical protein
LLAKAVDQPTCSVTGIPPSRASPLPHWDASSIAAAQGPAIPTARPNAKLHTDQKCGSGLARESGGSANMFGDWHTAFAGKPAPTLGDASSITAAQGPAIPTAQPNAKLHTDQKCGSGLAREGGGSANMFGDWHTAFAGKPAPTLGDASSALAVQPGNSNRAAKREASHRSKMWERACPRRRWIRTG